MGAVVDDAVEERLGLDALAHEPTLHVRDGHDQRVDPTVADHRLQLFEPGVLLGVGLVASAHGASPLCGLLAGRSTEGRPAEPGRPSGCLDVAAGQAGVGPPSSSAACSNSRSSSVSCASAPMIFGPWKRVRAQPK